MIYTLEICCAIYPLFEELLDDNNIDFTISNKHQVDHGLLPQHKIKYCFDDYGDYKKAEDIVNAGPIIQFGDTFSFRHRFTSVNQTEQPLFPTGNLLLKIKAKRIIQIDYILGELHYIIEDTRGKKHELVFDYRDQSSKTQLSVKIFDKQK